MLTRKDISKMIFYLKPYRHRCISKGATVLFEDIENPHDDLFIEDNLFCEYPNCEFNFLQSIWFEIIGTDIDGKEIHIGYITGYYINIPLLLTDFYYGGRESLIEFDDHSHLLMELWHHLYEASFGELQNDCYFLNSITIEKPFEYPEVEATIILLIESALYEIYRYKIKTIIYGIGRTELEDDTIGEDYMEINEIAWKRHKNNLIDIGFIEIMDENGQLIYYMKELKE